MDFPWQDFGVVVVIVAAAGYLGRRLWQVVRGKTPPKCPSCGQCGSRSEEQPLVTLDAPERK